jgi:Ras-related protein Rab-7A
MVESTKKTFCKVVALGDVGVGKTSLIATFMNDGRYKAPSQTTVGTEFLQKDIRADGTNISLQVWDTAGQERFESIGYAFYRGANCCLLVFDLSNKASFTSLDKWKKNFISNAAPANPDKFPFLVVANKKDLGNQAVSLDEVQAWARSNGNMPVIMTSAMNGEGVMDAFKQAAENGSKASMQGGANVAMPTSLSGAKGAIKLDANTDAQKTQEKKKKKGCC